MPNENKTETFFLSQNSRLAAVNFVETAESTGKLTPNLPALLPVFY